MNQLQDTTLKQVDTILHCCWVIPVEPHAVVLEDHSIVIHEGLIIDLLPIKNAKQLYLSDDTRHLEDHAVLPGFVNAHTHSPMVLFKGMADDLLLMDWLQNHIWPAESKWLSPEFIKDGMDLALVEMIRNGTTCFNDHYFFPDEIAQATKVSKLRACIGATIINFPTAWSTDENDGFKKFERFYQDIKHEQLLSASLAPHGPYTVTDSILDKIAHFSRDENLRVHMHVQETQDEIDQSLENFGKRPMQRLYDLGLLSERFQCVHMTQVDQVDIDLLKETGSHITHCPESNLKLASGYCPVDVFLQNDINVALGTDGAASNNNLDMIGEMRTAALVGKAVASSATAVSAPNAIRIATLGGAKALGIADRIGSIVKGKEADLVAINLNHVNTRPIYNPISQIVYSAANTQITDVWVAGLALLKQGELQTMDEERAFQEAHKWQERLRLS